MNKCNIERALKDCTRTQKNKYGAEYSTIDLKKVKEIFGQENVRKDHIGHDLIRHDIIVMEKKVAEVIISTTGTLKKTVAVSGIKPSKIPVRGFVIPDTVHTFEF